MSIESNATPVVSATFAANPRDSRCRYWCKVIRAGQPLPSPEAVSGANDIPGPYVRKGDDIEVFEGDYILEGEENSHRKARGWTYDLRYLRVKADGSIGVLCSGRANADVKAACRAAGRRDLLGGSGDVAAMVREIHAVRDGLIPQKPLAERVADQLGKIAEAEAGSEVAVSV